MNAMTKISNDLKDIAARLNCDINASAGEAVGFSLFIWTEGRCNYISNCNDRAEIKTALKSVVDGWDDGMPDIPAHEVT